MKNILIVYSSIAGSTCQTAEIIAEKLRARGMDARTTPAKGAFIDNDCDAVVLGSYVRYGKPAPEVRKFLRQNNERLQGMPTALFFSCLHITLEAGDDTTNTFIDPAFKALPLKTLNFSDRQHALGLYRKNLVPLPGKTTFLGYLKGRMNFGRLNPVDGLCMRIMSVFIPQTVQGDFFNADTAGKLADDLIAALTDHV